MTDAEKLKQIEAALEDEQWVIAAFPEGDFYSKTRWNEELGRREILGPDGNWHAY